MPTFDPSEAECFVYVYREGLAAAVGHDLAIEATRFEIEVQTDPPQAEARFEADSLQVRYAMDDGEPDRGALSGKDRKKIERNMRKDVLEVKKYPVIKFRSTDVSTEGGGLRLVGQLDLHGVERQVELSGRIEDGKSVLRGRIEQPDFDIEPYKALLGALKLKPHVDIEVSVPVTPDSD